MKTTLRSVCSMRILTLFFLLLVNSVSSQDKVKQLVDRTQNLKLDIWGLAEFAQENLTGDAELARFFYHWIGRNIKYDYEYLAKMTARGSGLAEYKVKQDPYKVYTDRKGVCGGYANLFGWFMSEVNIEVAHVTGHIRDPRNLYSDELWSTENYRHAWNAVKLNGKWVLVDTTWGASLDPSQSDFYFDMKPEIAIYTHFPQNSRWQLLKNPKSLGEFNSSKFVKPLWFASGFSDVPQFGKLKNYYYLTYKTNAKHNDFSIKLEISSDNLKYKPVKSVINTAQNGYAYVMFAKEQIPEKVFCKIHLYKADNLYHQNVIQFKTF